MTGNNSAKMKEIILVGNWEAWNIKELSGNEEELINKFEVLGFKY